MSTSANDRLRLAREGMSSRLHPGTSMGRDELAALVRDWITANDPKGRLSAFDSNHLGKLERGIVHRPSPIIRAALCATLDANESDLGFVSSKDAERVSQALSGHVHTDHKALAAIADVLASVRRLEDATSAADVLSTVQAQRSMVTRLADNARGDVRPDAVGLLSELEQYLGWLSIPLERWDDSKRHLDRASVLALEADDPERLAMALSFSAYRNLRRNDLRSAEALNAAAGRDDRVNIGLRTYTEFQRAELLARDGVKREAVKVLSDADRLVNRLPEDSDELPASSYWYVPSFFEGQRAFVLHALGDDKQAARVARDAIAAMPTSWRESEWAERRLKLTELDG
ncbi:XRE family transcriptional regulator [Amycolatopsis regifaucium]|uniref:XRE family transcriptional regulator n=1 Tax=Amycolatopsis regifaucium TaxID=546365 RepID=UPI001FC9C402|nr:XRE family transcriptional regulator [Amycolatopsis regifaucium]